MVTEARIAALCRKIASRAREADFVTAWKESLPDLARAIRGGTPAAEVLGRAFEAARHDPQLGRHLSRLPEEVWSAAREAVAGEAGSTHPRFLQWLRDLFRREAAPHSEVEEADGRPVRCVSKQAFRNWGRTVENQPFVTFIPTTKAGVCNIVKWAARLGKTVRASGYRHTWSDLYSSDGEVLISMLPLDVVEDLPASEPGIDPKNQLQGIEIVGEIQEGDVTKALCKIGAATTNEQFRRWCLSDRSGGGERRWTVPLNVIMVEISWGGSNAPICHGAGWRHRTLSDLVYEIEFVNAKGELQTVRDPDQLAAAAGCFGLLGIVTSLTLKLDPMTAARMRPEKKPLALTIPPPAGLRVPDAVDLRGIAPQQLEAAWADFVTRAETSYYAEWFWFTFQDECWINTWKNDGDLAAAKDYPGPLESEVQAVEELIANILNETVFRVLPGRVQADLLGATAMFFLPADETIVTWLIDALHFRRGIQNMRVLDMELEIPIPARADDPSKPDWTVCQKAWWAVISAVYRRFEADKDDVPLRLTLEMRVMADSEILMAPQKGNSFGTCSIEILTPVNVGHAEWRGFRQEISDAWMKYADAQGEPLNSRPHWAKQWQGLQARGLPIVSYLRDIAYKERIPEFGAALAQVAAAGGYSLGEMRKLFTNPLLGEIFGDVFR